jgi:hypothetical protein
VAVPRPLRRNVWIGSLFSLVLLAVCGPAEARQARLAWDFAATEPPQHTGFLVRGCQPNREGCVMKDLQHVSLDKREAIVQVPARKERCFIVQAIEPATLSAPSNLLCLSSDEEPRP